MKKCSEQTPITTLTHLALHQNNTRCGKQFYPPERMPLFSCLFYVSNLLMIMILFIQNLPMFHHSFVWCLPSLNKIIDIIVKRFCNKVLTLVFVIPNSNCHFNNQRRYIFCLTDHKILIAKTIQSASNWSSSHTNITRTFYGRSYNIQQLT